MSQDMRDNLMFCICIAVVILAALFAKWVGF